MPLTHVCIWDSQLGFRRVTAEDAQKLFPYGASARSGNFVCELCAQNVLFTAPGDKVQHFRHDPSAPNKECDERQKHYDPTYGRSILSINSHTMPLRIVVSTSSFSLEMGFFAIPNHAIRCDKIRITGDSHRQFEYSFDRIERGETTYLNIGSVPCENYRIEYVNANEELKRFWPSRVQGINSSGTFFEFSTRKMLQSGGKAYSDKAYYLLQPRPLYYSFNDIDATEIVRMRIDTFSTWYLYRISIKRFSEQSAKFFLKYAVFLTEKPTKFYPIWPPTIKSPYFLYHNANDLFFYLCGDDAELKTFPATAIIPSEKKLYRLFTREKEQLVSLGKTGALCFLYLIKQKLYRNAPLPSVEVFDQAGNVLTEDNYVFLPKSKLITVFCQYDGKVVVNKNGKAKYIYRLNAGQQIIIDEVSFGTEISIYQGIDCVRRICFEKNRKNGDAALLDSELVKKLNACSGYMIPVTHAFGAVVKRYSAYPQTQKWIFSVIRQGEASNKALMLILNSLPSNNGRDTIE